MPAPGLTSFTLPPAPKTSGTMTENPAPAAANPGSAQPGDGAHNAQVRPAAATRPPVRTVRTLPKRNVIASPNNRNAAIAAENTAYPAAAVPGPAARICRKYTPV